VTNRPFIAARIEEKLNAQVERILRRFGWHEAVIAYTGYATQHQARVLGRVVLVPPSSTTYLGRATEDFMQRRGWRNFFVAACVRAPAIIGVGDQTVQVSTDRGGYLDIRVKDHGLAPGWRQASISTSQADPVAAHIQVISDDESFGIVSDIDDTIISTWLPRIFLAAWNTFVVEESARQAVPGMADLYRELLDEHPGAPLIFVSTGAWNTAPMLERFLEHNGFPRGALLLTDWGPTNSGWFRSGQAHKRTCLRELARDFPNIRWILVGDDGQHDPALYGEFAERMPERVRVIGIRELTPAEQLLAHGTPTTMTDGDVIPDTAEVPEVRAPDGEALGPLIADELADA